jgi:UDP-N-acetylglucosamine diphosphorylase/glucosamine-1-phosphate N-acetyltransferase
MKATSNSKLHPITLTRQITDIHSGGFSATEEMALGFTKGDLFTEPIELFELITLHKKNFVNNLNKYKNKILDNNPEYKTIAPNVYAHTSAKIDSSVTYNTGAGIIVIEKEATILPFTYLVGPLRIDEHATISPHSYIGFSYIGKSCKVGGEITNSVFEQYSNKAHAGGMYYAYVGSWVNIGGGTSNSNLKNTYGTIKMACVETGEQFLGCIIADHAKTAINTSIYTGKIIGVGAHIYGTVTNDVPNFVNYYSKDNMTKIPIDVTEKIATRMMERRGVQFTVEDKNLLINLYKNE